MEVMIARVWRGAGLAVLGAASACGSASKNPAEPGGEGGGTPRGAAGGAAGAAFGTNGGSGASGGQLSASEGGATSLGAANQGGMVGGTGAAAGGSGGGSVVGGATGEGGERASAGQSPAGSSSVGASGGTPGDCLAQDIDVPVFVVSGAVTSAGSSTPLAGHVVFRSGDERLPVAAGAGPNAYALRLVPGSYDIFYEELSPLRLGVTVGPSSPTTLDLEVRLAKLSFKVTVNGSAPSSTDGGKLSLKNTYGMKPLGEVSPQVFAIDVAAGSYDLIYDGLSASGTSPRNSGAKVQTVTLGASDLAVAVDLPSVLLSGHVTRGGKPVLGANAGVLVGYLAGADLGKAPITVNEAGEYSVRVLPGSYNVEAAAGGTIAGNRILADTSRTVDIELPEAPAYSAVVEGSMKFNGQAVSDVWGLLLHDRVGGNDMSLVSSSESYRFDAQPGTYDVFYQVNRSSLPSMTMPKNRRALLKSGFVLKADAKATLDIDVPVGVLKGKFTIGGAALPDVSGDGSLVLRDGLGDEFPFDAHYDGEYTLPVVTGTYDVYFKVGLFGSVAPRNTGKKIKRIVVTQGEDPIDVDVPTRRIQGALTINGVSGLETADLASISLRGEDGDTVPLGSVVSKSYSTTVVPGTYDVYFGGRTSNTFAPVNGNAKIGCLRVP